MASDTVVENCYPRVRNAQNCQKPNGPEHVMRPGRWLETTKGKSFAGYTGLALLLFAKPGIIFVNYLNNGVAFVLAFAFLHFFNEFGIIGHYFGY